MLGIDVSTAMIEEARKNVPNARFEKLDVRKFEPDGGQGSLDAVTVYFSMIASVTQEEIRDFIRQIYGWLKPGGVFVFATVPLAGNNLEIKWMGRPIVVSSLEADDAVKWIKDVGFEIEYQDLSKFVPKASEAGICDNEDVWEEPHLFVYARSS